jgi:hypothetical protein
MEALEQQSKESLELTEKLLSTTASLHAQTEAQAKMKDAYSYKVYVRYFKDFHIFIRSSGQNRYGFQGS